MPRQRITAAGRDRGKQQVRIQRSQTIRTGLGKLSDPEVGDLMPLVGAAPGTASGVDSVTQPRSTGATLNQVIGCRRPVVLIRIRRRGDDVLAELTRPPRPGIADALECLRLLVEQRFRTGLKLLQPDECARLLGNAKASPIERLLLLTRLARPGTEPIVLPDGRNEKANDHGQARYHGKFATLPDGTSFSIGLLLGGVRQGKRSKDPARAGHPFGKLPRTVKLLALQRALAREREEGVAREDAEFRHLLLDAVNELGVPLDEALFKEQVEALRNDDLKLLRGTAWADLFPRAALRQKDYDRGPTP